MNKIYPYAGFWKRALSFLIDGLILTIPLTLLSGLAIGTQVMSLVKMASLQQETTPEMILPFIGKWMAAMFVVWVLTFVLVWLYFALFESGKRQATPGKMALGIKVVGAQGQRISFARATGRTFGKFISNMILYFGNYMAGFTQKRQALHDLMADTYVVDKNFPEGQELPTLAFSKGGLVAGIIAAVAPIALYMCMIIVMMLLAVANMKDDPDMHDFWKELKSDSATQTTMSDTHRDLLLITAKIELRNLAKNHQTLNTPLVKEEVTYSQSLEGYRATIDANGQTYELLLRPGAWDSCCAKGPNGSCGDNALYEPCK